MAKAKQKEEYLSIGRRKQAAARTRLSPGTGEIQVNKREFSNYFRDEALRNYITQPLEVAGVSGSFDIKSTIRGGGSVGQAGALRHGIARALAAANPDFRTPLKQSGMLTRDARVKERKKYGQPGARKKYQFSKR